MTTAFITLPGPPGSTTTTPPSVTVGSATDIDQSTPGNTNGVTMYGTAGLDFSANKLTIPNVGVAFAASGPYASYVLVQTIPANATRSYIDIQNISGAQIAVVRDDGTVTSGAPTNASVFALAGGATVGSQGGSWNSNTCKGRLQIYAPSSAAIVTVMVD